MVSLRAFSEAFLSLWFSWTRSILTAELFLRQLVRLYGRHPVYTDRAPWYPEACRSLGLEHRPLEDSYRSLIEGAIQYLKDRTEGFDDHYPCWKEGCRLTHEQKWLEAFVLHRQPEYLRLIASIKEVMSLR